MIDLHCHILPGIDDGASSLSEALEMAQIAAGDGITHVVCSSHVIPGLYNNTTETISERMSCLRSALVENDVELELVIGADIHIAPNLVQRLAGREIPTIAGSNYFLFEPPHHVIPPMIDKYLTNIKNSGFNPIITHPERLTWIEAHYNVIEKLHDAGMLMQVTAGSLTGGFGTRARYWAERMLSEGRVDVVATDAHNVSHRRPVLSRARDVLASKLGEEEAEMMVLHRPTLILNNEALPEKRQRDVKNERRDTLVGKVIGWLK